MAVSEIYRARPVHGALGTDFYDVVEGATFPKHVLIPTLQRAFASAIVARLGIASRGPKEDDTLIAALLHALTGTGAQYEQTLFDWFGGAISTARADGGPAADTYARRDFQRFRSCLAEYQPLDPHCLDHSYFTRSVPTTILIDEVEDIWSAIADDDDWSKFEAKIEEIRTAGKAYSLVVIKLEK
jgi:uncharacterized protein YdiU (UPF0061 family)